MGSQFAFLASSVQEVQGADTASSGVDIGINGYFDYSFFGHTVSITNTHIAILLVMVTLIIFAIVANRVIKNADPTKPPGGFLNIVEIIVEKIDGLTVANMGEEHGYKFANWIGTLFIFLLLSNISGLFGLRPPTADYGVTLSLGLITFFLIHYNGFKYQKFGHITGLFQPIPLLFPINLIGELATPLSMSLRLFGNVLSGTVMMGLIYGLVPKVLTLVWPSVLHAYFDVFSGAIQTYVFCMLTMVFISQTFDTEEA
ncbi:ATP synthase F0 sector subunit a [Lachnospiraceae bacterium KM106-2]|nr:ATP synthase F0 sector subunit a [Lachnospiraceae bacterium KM106-2]